MSAETSPQKAEKAQVCTCDGAVYFTPEQNAERRPFLVDNTCPMHGSPAEKARACGHPNHGAADHSCAPFLSTEKTGCGHSCKCHAINPGHDCEQSRTSIVMEWYEKDALKRIFRECGPDAAVEMVNRLLTATASHQYAKGIETGELWERTESRNRPGKNGSTPGDDA